MTLENIKLGQILGSSKNGSWALVDARNVFFLDLLIESMHRKLWICAKMQLHQNHPQRLIVQQKCQLPICTAKMSIADLFLVEF